MLSAFAKFQKFMKRKVVRMDRGEFLTKKMRDYPDDATLRANHPGIQEAWEQYQILIKLAGGLTEEDKIAMRPKRRALMK